jgi:hypothetical protein
LALFSSFLNVACVLVVQTNERYIIKKGKGIGKGQLAKVYVLTRIRNLVSTFHSKQAALDQN